MLSMGVVSRVPSLMRLVLQVNLKEVTRGNYHGHTVHSNAPSQGLGQLFTHIHPAKGMTPCVA